MERRSIKVFISDVISMNYIGFYQPKMSTLPKIMLSLYCTQFKMSVIEGTTCKISE